MSTDRRAAAGGSRAARRHAARACAVAAALLTAACATSSGGSRDNGHRLDFSTPTPPAASPVNLGPGSVGAATDAVAGRLRAAGIQVTSVNAGTGTVLATSSDNALVNCGEVTQTLDGNRATFAGNAPTAVVFAFGQPGDIVLREVSAEAWIEVGIVAGPSNAASVGEVHRVTIRHLTADRSQTVWSQTESFDGRSVVGFADGTACTSSGVVRDIVG